MVKRSVEIEVVRNEPGYRRALKRVAWFFDHPPKAGSSEDAGVELLMMMVGRYEAEHHPVPPPRPCVT